MSDEFIEEEAIEYRSPEVLLTHDKGKTQICIAFGECTKEIEDKDKKIFNTFKEFLEKVAKYRVTKEK